MSDMGIFVMGESDYVFYEHSQNEANTLAKHGARYIKDNIKDKSHPVSFVGLMLDGDWMDSATHHQKGVVGGIICGLCYDLIFGSETWKTGIHKTFKKPTFLFTAFRRKLSVEDYDYYLRLVGVIEWAESVTMQMHVMSAFKSAQSLNPIKYTDDSVASLI